MERRTFDLKESLETMKKRYGTYGRKESWIVIRFGKYGRKSANLELLIDNTSSRYLYVKLKALASWIFLSFTSFWRNSDSYENKNNRL